MPRDPRVLVFVGIKNAVVALDDKTGYEVWRTELRSGGYMYVVWDGQSIYATCAGEVWRLDPENGSIIWHNQLKGLGRGLASVATTRAPSQSGIQLALRAAQRAADAAAESAASG